MPIYYDVDLRNASLKEFAFGVPWHQLPLTALAKWCRLPMHGSTDDPPVETLAPFEVDAAAVPEEIHARFAPVAADLAALGFHSPVYHVIPYARHATRSYWATFRHERGKAWARIHCRIWWGEGRDRYFFFPMFFTAFDDGTFLVSSGGKQDMFMPDGVRFVNHVDANATEVWELHQRELAASPARPVLIHEAEQLRHIMEEHHAKLRDFNLQRGVFQPLPEAEQQNMADPAGLAVPAAAVPEDMAVFAELERLQQATSSKKSGLLVLAVSLALFALAARFAEDWWFWLAIIPVLLFHELGHYVAMRWFGYRNLKMFFIPLLGAAVSGRHYNVAGWKKAIVALAGPVPGVFVGAGLGAAGWWLDQPHLIMAAVLTLIVNGLNLLPLLPLDGGWVVHVVLFARHPVLDAVFRLVAVLALAGLSLWSGSKLLLILPALLLLGLPMSWQVARLAQRLRRQGVDAASPDAQTIPPETAALLLSEMRTTLPKVTMPQLQAHYILQTFETLNARPPGLLASLALLTVQGVSFAAAAVLSVLFIGRHEGLF